MRKYVLPGFVLVLFSLLSLSSCSDDDTNEAPEQGTGNATYDGNNINFTQGVITNYGEAEEGLYNFDIDLLSDDFQIDFANETVSGVGQLVYFELWTTNASGLKEGTYKLENGKTDFGMTYGEFSSIYDFNNDQGSFMEANEAELNLSRNGEAYNLTFTLTFPDGKKLTGSYSGGLYPITAED